MKLSYTIRHWPDLDWGRFCAAAADAKLSGLEIDSVRNPVLTGKNSPANPELAAAARRQLADLNLSIPCVGVEGDPVKPESAGELAAALEAARNLLVPYVVLHTTCEDTKAVIAALEGPVAQEQLLPLKGSLHSQPFLRTKAFLGILHMGQLQSAGSSSKPKLGSLYS